MCRELGKRLSPAKLSDAFDEMDKDDMIAAPMSWWSGWSYKEGDRGLGIEFGSSYCAQGMNIVDWGVETLPVPIKTIGFIGYAGDYAADFLAGVKAAAATNGDAATVTANAGRSTASLCPTTAVADVTSRSVGASRHGCRSLYAKIRQPTPAWSSTRKARAKQPSRGLIEGQLRPDPREPRPEETRIKKGTTAQRSPRPSARRNHAS